MLIIPNKLQNSEQILYTQFWVQRKHTCTCIRIETYKLILKDKFTQRTCRIDVKCYSMNVKMTLECQIFIWKALWYARHFSQFSSTKPNATKSYGRSHYPRSCSNLWCQSRTAHWLLLWKITGVYFIQKSFIICS